MTANTRSSSKANLTNLNFHGATHGVCVCECIINEPREVFERSIIDLFEEKKTGKEQLHGQLYIVSYDTWDDCIDLSSRVKRRSSFRVITIFQITLWM